MTQICIKNDNCGNAYQNDLGCCSGTDSIPFRNTTSIYDIRELWQKASEVRTKKQPWDAVSAPEYTGINLSEKK